MQREGNLIALMGSASNLEAFHFDLSKAIVCFLWIQRKPKKQTKSRSMKTKSKHERDQISAKRLTAGHTESSEIGIQTIEPKESSASSGFEERGSRDANKVARGEEDRENQHKNQRDGDTWHAVATSSGKVG